MSTTATDLWAHCDACHRWFACPRHVGHNPLCPVCISEASMIVDRAARAAADHRS